jgi:hypothetical protein
VTVSAAHKDIQSQANGEKKTHIKHRILDFPLAAQHEQRGEIVRLHNGEVACVICDQASKVSHET